MSLSLYLVVDDHEIDLWQTPAYVTYMCMIDDNSVQHYKLSGKKAKAAVARYLEWARDQASKVFSSNEDTSEILALVTEHTQMVQNAIEHGSRVIVYAMQKSKG